VKEFDDLTDDEKEKILKQLNELPGQTGDSLDMFVRSFDDLSKTWTNAIKEFDDIYLDTLTTFDLSKLGSQDNTNWKSKAQRFLN